MQHIEPKIAADHVYTPESAAELFAVPPGTIRRLVRQGSIKGFIVGANVRILGADLLAFIADGGARVKYRPGAPVDADPAADPTKITNDGTALADTAADRIAAAADGVTVPAEMVLA